MLSVKIIIIKPIDYNRVYDQYSKSKYPIDRYNCFMTMTPSYLTLLETFDDNCWRFSKQDFIEQINAGWLMLMSQPIIRLGDVIDADCFAAVCLRWMPEERENSMPGTFLAALEDAGLAPIADRWAIHCTARVVHADNKLHRLKAPTLRPRKKYSIHLSEQSIVSDKIGRYISNVLQKESISGSQFVFESTFDVALRNSEAFSKLAKLCSDLDCAIILTGTPTLDELIWARKILRIRFIKLDLGGSSTPAGFRHLEKKYATLIYCCSRLKIRTIAQFVEQPGIIPQLQKIGVDFVQGYGLAMPTLIDSEAGLPFTLPEEFAHPAPPDHARLQAV